MKKKNLLMTAIAIFGLATITMAQVPNYVPTNGLVGWWPFNGNANDESGNGNNGVVTNAVLTNDRNNNTLSAYSFDFVGKTFGNLNKEIYFPYSSSYNVNNLTVSVWVYPRAYFWTGDINNPNSVIIRRYQYGYSNPNGQVWGIDFNSNSVSGFILAPSSQNNQASASVISNTSLSLNQWHHIVMSYDGNALTLYLNGINVSSTNTNLTLNTAGNSGISVGVSNQANGYWEDADAVIDDIGIWNSALTQQEITDLYNGCQLSVNTQPTNQTININNNAQFVVSSSDPGATYQWQTDLGMGFQNLNSVGQYSGTTNDTLTVSNVTMSNNNQPFRCIISSGSCSDTSNVAVLTVNNNVGINETLQDNLFSVFPNPAQSVINVKADSKLIGSVYSIYDNTGRVVLLGKLNAESTTIELGNLSGGIYMLSVGENMKQTFKIIKAE